MPNQNFSSWCSSCNPAGWRGQSCCSRCSPCFIPGPPGPTGPAGGLENPPFVVPFSSDKYDDSLGDFERSIAVEADGTPYIIEFVSFGGNTSNAGNSIIIGPGEWASGVITITLGRHYGTSFIMPRDGVLQSISLVFANMNGSGLFLPPGAILRPFVSIGTMSPGASSLAFRINPQTITYAQPYIGTGEPIQKYTPRWGSRENLSAPIAKGTSVAIILGMTGENLTEAIFTNAAVSGSLYFA